MSIHEHPVAQVSGQVDALLPCNRIRRVFSSLHIYGDKLIADFGGHLGVVDCRKFVIFDHFFVQDESLLDVLLVELEATLTHLSFRQLLPSILIHAVAIEEHKAEQLSIEF